MTHDPQQPDAEITIREMNRGEADAAALNGLAALDSRSPLQGPVLGAELDGRLVAAVSLRTGEQSADPFSRSSELRALLELRAAQLREAETGGAGRRTRRLGWRAHRSRPALGGSPAGQIITMPRVRSARGG